MLASYSQYSTPLYCYCFKGSEEDSRLQEEIDMLVNKLMNSDEAVQKLVLEQLCDVIKSSSTSMACIPAPLKHLSCHYSKLKDIFSKAKQKQTRKLCSDIISVLAIVACRAPDALQKRECLKFCLLGTKKHVGDWGHEYVRHLEEEVIEEWNSTSETQLEHRTRDLMPLIKQIIHFNMNHNAELQTCDFLMELDQLSILRDYIDCNNYTRVCLYLLSCAKYEDGIESDKILQHVLSYYLAYDGYPQAMHLALQTNNLEAVKHIFETCPDMGIQKQLAFMLAQQKLTLDISEDLPNAEDIQQIISNVGITDHFHNLARELDILEPKTPEEVYKTWLEGSLQSSFGTEKHLDSAKQNLASTFVNAFVNAGFGKDKLLTTDEGKKWIYRNKESGMLSATASLGLIYLWDVEGGLTPIDCYLYSSDNYVKAGALLAIGMVNLGVRNPFEPAKALLSDYIADKNDILRTSAILGLGFAYAGTKQQEIVNVLIPALQEPSLKPEVASLIALSLSLIMVGSADHELTSSILQVLQDMTSSHLGHTYSRFFALALGICFLGRRDAIEPIQAALDVLADPFKGIAKTMLSMCAYAGSGDVLKVQEMLHICGRLDDDDGDDEEDKSKDAAGGMEALAVLGVAAIAMSEDISSEMCSRIFGHLGRYGELTTRRAVPLAMALCFISNPQITALEMLNKYSHDTDLDVCLSAIFAMGLTGAGTNNARLATMLHQLALFHSKNPNQMFMVRLAQGLLHMGKGTMTLSPFHMDKQVMNPTAMAGLLIVLVAFLDAKNIILGKSHHLLYSLVLAMRPRWLVTLDENLEPLSVSVRVGQALDVVGKAGSPKTITGMHTHNTPVLLAEGERAELASDEYVPLSAFMEGFVILRKKCQQ